MDAFAGRVTCVVMGPAASGAVAARFIAEATAETRHVSDEHAHVNRLCLAPD
jgi:hypothetical protein